MIIKQEITEILKIHEKYYANTLAIQLFSLSLQTKHHHQGGDDRKH